MFKNIRPTIAEHARRAVVKSLEAHAANSSDKDVENVIGATEDVSSHFEFTRHALKSGWKTFNESTQETNKRIVGILHEMLKKERVFDGDKGRTLYRNIIPYDILIKSLQSRQKVYDLMKHFVTTHPPTTEEEYKIWFKKFQTDVNSVKDVTHIECTDTGVIRKTEAYVKPGGKLAALGYGTFDKFYKIDTLVKNTDHLLKAWEEMDDSVFSYGEHVTKTPDNKKHINSATYDIENVFIDWAWWDFRTESDYALNAMRGLVMCTTKVKK